ncbi:MAG TPA: NIPSNAP family protein [Sediminibacterium sp.]|nr:NIPSNAP family protein [Sediminibacterium sp.]
MTRIFKTVCAGLLLAILFPVLLRAAGKRSFYEIKIFHLRSAAQVQQVDAFLEQAYFPALHKAGIQKIGAYHWMGNDTANDKKVIVFIPLRSIQDITMVDNIVVTDPSIASAGEAYWNAAYNAPPFNRIETVVLQAFPKMPSFEIPELGGDKADHIYELRSYEGPTERLYRQKLKMFNTGGEVALFKRLQFHAVFYAQVIAGSHMPNLMYMTSFLNQSEHDAHWKAFGSDPEWVKLKNEAEYLNTVSRADVLLMHPTPFSEI